MSDAIRKLVGRCLGGDQSAMLELVETHSASVFGLCFGMLRHRQDAEDVAQESFVRALRSLRTWDQEREFLPWLLAIAGNRCRTLLSMRYRRPIASGQLEHASDQRAQQGDASELAEEVDRALGTLRSEYRQAFLLFHQHELSYADIARSLDVPLGTVKTWVHRARRELIGQLQSRGVIEESQQCDAKNLKIG